MYKNTSVYWCTSITYVITKNTSYIILQYLIHNFTEPLEFTIICLLLLTFKHIPCKVSKWLWEMILNKLFQQNFANLISDFLE